jgi:NmrA-like family
MKNTILVAGATGHLGFKITKALCALKAPVRVLVRASSNAEKKSALKALGADVVEIQDWNLTELSRACTGVHCVVSALAGLKDVVLDAQTVLLDAAVAAGVPRFIPSDFSLDFTKFSDGENRNLDLRRDFHTYLDKQNIKATTIFNGAFAELLTGDMPLILFKQKRILHWGSADKRYDFTTTDNIATYTAHAALDADTPRFLHIASEQITPKEIKALMSELTGQSYGGIRPGGQWLLGVLIKITRKMAGGENELYPPWQGMQYMHNMIDERSTVPHLDNDRYPQVKWTKVRELLRRHLGG